MGYSITKVETYIPNPLRCYNCQKFRYHKEKCTRSLACKNCGEIENYVDCQQPQKCVNCKQNHAADSKESEFWGKNIRSSTQKKTSNSDATKFVENSLDTRTYAYRPKPQTTQKQGISMT